MKINISKCEQIKFKLSAWIQATGPNIIKQVSPSGFGGAASPLLVLPGPGLQTLFDYSAKYNSRIFSTHHVLASNNTITRNSSNTSIKKPNQFIGLVEFNES